MWTVLRVIMRCYNGDVSSTALLIVFHIIIVTGFAIPHTKIVVSEVRAGWSVDNDGEKWSHRPRNSTVSRNYFRMTDDAGCSWWPSTRCRSAKVQSNRSVYRISLINETLLKYLSIFMYIIFNKFFIIWKIHKIRLNRWLSRIDDGAR